jgi:hypothetical protein
MTEVEFSRLLSELADSAKALNAESDSINEIIKRFEDALRRSNLGLEVWLTSQSIDSQRWSEPAHDGQPAARGTLESELGFAKNGNQWHLVVREARYEHVEQRYLEDPEIVFDGTLRVQNLLECSREVRIDALRLFPLLAKEMREEAASALKAIQDAKKFVK